MLTFTSRRHLDHINEKKVLENVLCLLAKYELPVDKYLDKIKKFIQEYSVSGEINEFAVAVKVVNDVNTMHLNILAEERRMVEMQNLFDEKYDSKYLWLMVRNKEYNDYVEFGKGCAADVWGKVVEAVEWEIGKEVRKVEMDAMLVKHDMTIADLKAMTYYDYYVNYGGCLDVMFHIMMKSEPGMKKRERIKGYIEGFGLSKDDVCMKPIYLRYVKGNIGIKDARAQLAKYEEVVKAINGKGAYSLSHYSGIINKFVAGDVTMGDAMVEVDAVIKDRELKIKQGAIQSYVNRVVPAGDREWALKHPACKRYLKDEITMEQLRKSLTRKQKK